MTTNRKIWASTFHGPIKVEVLENVPHHWLYNPLDNKTKVRILEAKHPYGVDMVIDVATYDLFDKVRFSGITTITYSNAPD